MGGARRSEISATVRHLDMVGRRDKSPAFAAWTTAGDAVGLQFVGCRNRFSGAVQDALIAREQASPPPPSMNSPPPARRSALAGRFCAPRSRQTVADDACRTYKDIKDRTRRHARSSLYDKLLYGTAVRCGLRVTNSSLFTTRVFSPFAGPYNGL